MTRPEWSNEEWLTALRAERDDAWAALRERVRRGLLAYLREGRSSGLEEDALRALAEDATQDTLLTVRAKLDTFRSDSRFTTWVYRIAVNTLLAEFRRRRWEQRAPAEVPDSSPEWPLEGPAATPEREAIQRETWSLFRKLIEDELTAHQRQILLAHVFSQKPLDLVAADLGISRDAVYKAIHDARRKLRAALLTRGITATDVLVIFGSVLGTLVLLFGLTGSALAADLEVGIVGLKDGMAHPDPKLGPVVIVSLKVKDFEVKDFTKATEVNGREGHIHIWLDKQAFNTLTSEPVWVFGGVKPGKHTLYVELVHNNHTPLNPPVKKTITFTMVKQ